MYENLSDFCESNNEDVEDDLFSMLTTTLFDKGKAELPKKSTVCGQNRLKMFKLDECLPNQIDMLQTKNQYKKQYDFLNSKNQFIYKPLYSLDKIEETYLPPS